MATEQASARLGHGKVFNPAHYPTLDQLKAKYDFRVIIQPMPAAEDFRVELSGEEEQRIREEITADVNDSLSNATKDVWKRFYEVLESLVMSCADRQGAKTKDGKNKGPRIVDATMDNLKNLLDLLPGLNLTQDPEMTALAQETRERLGEFQTQELRDSATARTVAVNAAQEIMDKMKGYMA